MADICAVCDKKVSIFNEEWVQGKPLHRGDCVDEFKLQPEKYGGTSTEQRRKENSETTKIQKEATEQRRKEQEDKSVYVKGFRMPFGEMVTFIFKWTMASIPTAIFLAILFLIFTAIFA